MKWNCTRNGKEPDWKKYNALELATCCEESICGDKFWERTDSVLSGSETIYTLYGHFKDNNGLGAEALHDFKTKNGCFKRAQLLKEKYNLKVYDFMV